MMVAVAAATNAAAQQPEGGDVATQPPSSGQLDDSVFEDAAAAAWFRLPFEERARRFAEEGRDREWAPFMERAIAEEVASWQRPRVDLVCVECHAIICRIETSWPQSAGRPSGQLISYLYNLGLDHQGEYESHEDGSRIQAILFARRR